MSLAPRDSPKKPGKTLSPQNEIQGCQKNDQQNVFQTPVRRKPSGWQTFFEAKKCKDSCVLIGISNALGSRKVNGKTTKIEPNIIVDVMRETDQTGLARLPEMQCHAKGQIDVLK
jgi:hypothetical protein